MAKLVSTNRKAYRDYFIEKTWECGIALKGCEVKSIRNGQINFKDSYAKISNRGMDLFNFHITPYKEASYMNQEPDRPRRLLLHKKEIKKIDTLTREKGFSLVPTKIFINERGLVKIEIACAKGKRQYDKREAIKKRQIKRDIGRMIRQRQRVR